MFFRLVSVTLALGLLAAPPGAGAQTRATVVVPADAAVVVPPRGAAALPRPAMRPVAARPRLPPMEAARGGSGPDLGDAGAVAGVLLPAIAAAALTAVLSNGGGAGGSGNHAVSGPARTR